MAMDRNTEKILTISIAAYNVEAYIRQTLDSLVDERIIDDLEVFVIDDGGTDQTLEIAKEYAAKYPNSIFPVHKENGGYGTTVNYSIAHATGKYFKLLDGDDWFDQEGLYLLVSTLKDCDEDLVVTPYRVGNPAKKMKTMTFPEAQGKEYVPINELKSSIWMWAITFRTQILKSCGVTLPAHALYTDMIYSVIPSVSCENALFLSFVVYCYRIGREGQSADRKARIKYNQDYVNNVEILCNFYVSEKQKGNINIDYLLRCVANLYCNSVRYSMLAPASKKTFQKIKAYEKKTHTEFPNIYYKAQTFGKRGMMLSVLRKTGYLPYWFLKLIPGRFL